MVVVDSVNVALYLYGAWYGNVLIHNDAGVYGY